MNIHLSRAGQLLKHAVLPDRAISRFVGAALDGSGSQNKGTAALKGLGEDAFELVANPARALVELGRALRG